MAERALRWLHLSDFHARTSERTHQPLFREILDHIRQRCAAVGPPDFVCVTGNLACQGQAAEYAELSQQFFDALPQVLGEGWSGHLYLVPGERDADPGGSPPPRSKLAEPGHEAFWEVSEQGAQQRHWVWGRFESYAELEQRYARTDGEWLRQPAGHFVDTWTVPESETDSADGESVRVGILGLNTAWIAEGEGDAGQLSPGLPLVLAGLDAIADCPVRFVLGHHPLEWFTDETNDALRKLFAQRHVLYLHGHADRSQKRPGKGGGPAFLTLQSGCSFLPEPPEDWRQGLVWGELDRSAQQVRVQPLRWSAEAQAFVCDPQAFPARRRIENSETWSFPQPGTTPAKPAADKGGGAGAERGRKENSKDSPKDRARDRDRESKPRVSAQDGGAPAATAEGKTDAKGRSQERAAKGKERAKDPAKGPGKAEPPVEAEPVGPLQEPKGWRLLDAAGFAALATPAPEAETLLGFVDGLGPDAAIALAEPVPVRAGVTEALARLQGALSKAERPCVLLIEGPPGEGKSTAFYQALAQLMQAGAAPDGLLWRERAQGRLPAEFIQKLARRPGGYLLALDDADNVTNDLTASLKTLHKAGRADIHFVVALRSLTRGGGNREQEWQQAAILIRLALRELEAEEAGAIWRFWSDLGAPAQGDLAEQTEADAVKAITESFARERKNTDEGALLGALLTVRTDATPSEYGHRLLGPLNEQGAPGGTLLAGFAYIAQMHAEGFGFLSRTVLAAVLDCDERACDQEVIAPLQDQGLVTVAGPFVQTRHRRIAELSVKTLEEDGYAEALEDNLVAMVRTAILLAARGHSVPALNGWQVQVADHFSKQGRHASAIRIARAVQETDRDSVECLVHLSRVLRRAGRAAEAIALFSTAAPDLRDPRAFYQEWGAAASAANDFPLGVWMLGMALADGGPPPDLELVRHALAGLGTAFRDLHEHTKDKRFVQARGAIGQMGLRLRPDDRSKQKFQKHRESAEQAGVGEFTVDYAVGAIKAAVARGSELYDGEDAIDMEQRFPDPYALSYRTLTNILNNPQAAARPAQSQSGGGPSGAGEGGRPGGKGRGRDGGPRDKDQDRDRDRGKPRAGRGGKPGGGGGGGAGGGRGQPSGRRRGSDSP